MTDPDRIAALEKRVAQLEAWRERFFAPVITIDDGYSINDYWANGGMAVSSGTESEPAPQLELHPPDPQR